ncbi:hypothetical protein RFI_30965 [Reticulomyxa filosa]|uniref:L-2-hydroxyglutarate dehydrogenase, mitochondrial n=1 Tax=Reticulomyxa filosa TaxID=46433 RepID=X6LWZ0_RETFI|nr:hypothetical protein RFI_30965 [Reticulomyxa filosa]|eukprot:ETO06433.1 hypothetical protein RFI_30965 [Reticulomyxa filosa]
MQPIKKKKNKIIQTGIVDYKQVCGSILQEFVDKLNGEVFVSQTAHDFRICEERKEGDAKPEKRGVEIVCNGNTANSPIQKLKMNIYPVPNPRFPALGVHFTPRIDGSILLGPSAVLAFSREGYNFTDFNLRDVFQMITFPGFWKMLWTHRQYEFVELKNALFLRFQLRELQKYVPSLTIHDVLHCERRSGIRAQLMDEQGELVKDFVFSNDDKGMFLHVQNAPSPGCTSCFPIAKLIADKAETLFGLQH